MSDIAQNFKIQIIMSKKNTAKKAQNENVNAVVANEAAAKAEAERLMAAAKEAAAAAKAAAKEAKEAARKAKAFSSRPVRKSYFEVRVAENIQDVAQRGEEGEFLFKSDVHYCAEKTAIDCLINLREQYRYDKHVYVIYKVAKECENGTYTYRQAISFLYLDEKTNQIVID